MGDRKRIAVRDRQKGIGTLTVTLILLLVATLATLSAGRAALVEQKISAVDLRSKEVHAAAMGGLDYAVHLIERQARDARDNPASHAHSFMSLWNGVGAGAEITISADQNTSLLPQTHYPLEMVADSYEYDIRYTARTALAYDPSSDTPVMIQVAVTARAVRDSHITKTVYADVMLGFSHIFSWPGNHFLAPPLVVEDCISDALPHDIHLSAAVEPLMATTQGLMKGNTLEDCLTSGYGTAGAAEPQSDLWQTIFGAIDPVDLKEVAMANPDRILWVDNGYPYADNQPPWNGVAWSNSVGTSDNPVILIFDRSVGCPSFSGAVGIYGIVFFENPDCAAHDLGRGSFVGTVALAGDVRSLMGEAAITGRVLDFTGGALDPRFSWTSRFHFYEVPGSWRDF